MDPCSLATGLHYTPEAIVSIACTPGVFKTWFLYVVEALMLCTAVVIIPRLVILDIMLNRSRLRQCSMFFYYLVGFAACCYYLSLSDK